MNGEEALARMLSYPDIVTVLDVGSGDGHHAAVLRASEKQVTTISLEAPADVIADYLTYTPKAQFDAIWACHVLEHQLNVNAFLKKCFSDLKDNGILAITVPPAKMEIVGGHVTLWNAGLLLYNLILAGFDCSRARVSSDYGYNISVIVRKKLAKLPVLRGDYGDIELLAKFFPFKAEHGFNGRLSPINW